MARSSSPTARKAGCGASFTTDAEDTRMRRMRSRKPTLDLTAPLTGTIVDKQAREAYVFNHVRATLPAQLRAIRRQRGLTQKVLAGRIGTSIRRISQMERANWRHTFRIDT